MQKVRFWRGLTSILPLALCVFALKLHASTIIPIDAPIIEDMDKVNLGKRLFGDPILFNQGGMTCLSCHNLTPDSTFDAVKGHPLTIDSVNIPTLLNTSLNFRWHWNGEFTTMESQFVGLMKKLTQEPMSSIVARLSEDIEYQREFRSIYGGITVNAITDAIIAYQKVLITPSPFDAYLKGDVNAITDQAKIGYQRFKDYGCISCHQGKNIGGNLMQKIGLINPYFTIDNELTQIDYGHFNVTGNPDDKFVFRVPSLRNVALTPPYFHNGSIERLNNAVRAIAYYQVGRIIPIEDVEYIVAFLQSLSGELPEELVP